MRHIAAVLLFALSVNTAAAEEWVAPLTERFQPDWEKVHSALPAIPQPGNADQLAALTGIAVEAFPAVARSPVPVLLPFAIADYAHDRVADTIAPREAYMFDFAPSQFFLAGPTGYDATFTVRLSDIEGLEDIRFRDPVVIQISGFNMLYKLPPAHGAVIQRPGEIEKEFPGITRQILEHTLRYSFERFGIPYVVAIQCYDGPQRRTRLACRNADRIATKFLRSLRLVGGNPAAESVSTPPALVPRPEPVSKVFSYHPVGKLIPGTGMRAPEGDPDNTVYARIRFPTAVAPAYVSTQIFRRRDKSRPPSIEGEPDVDAYRWRDNFCEKRDFQVGQCPSGRGHQGQDIRGLTCHSGIDSKTRCRPNQDALVAIRDGMIQREPWNEAFFLFVNAAGERMRFRHLHMHPKHLDSDNIVGGAVVKEGQPIGTIGNFDRRPNLTTTHLHFELQVPTRDGFVRVNPYLTLIAAYERLLGARGTEYIAAAPMAAKSDGPAEATMDEPSAAAMVAVSTAAAARVAAASAKDGAVTSGRGVAKERRKVRSHSARWPMRMRAKRRAS